MAAPMPAGLMNREGTAQGDAERAGLEQWAKSRGMAPSEVKVLVDALDASRQRVATPDWQLEIDRVRYALEQNGTDPGVIDMAVRLMQQSPEHNPGKRPLVDREGNLPGDREMAASREIMGPAPGKSKQLAGRAPDFMQDQRADTFTYQQPDLYRARPTRPTPTPSNTPPMLDRNRAPFLVRKPDGSFEFDPTYGKQAPADGFTGPEAPPITARTPPFVARSSEGDQRYALYRELEQAIQGRIAPAPDNLAATMGDAYVLEQMIPALRERNSDRPDVLARLDAIQAHAGRGQPAPVRMGLDEFGDPIPEGNEADQWRNLRNKGEVRQGRPSPQYLPADRSHWDRGYDPTWGPKGEPTRLPFQDNPAPYTPARSGGLVSPRQAAMDKAYAAAQNAKYERVISAPELGETASGRSLARGIDAAVAPDTVAGELAGPPPRAPAPVRPVPIRPQETTGINGPMDPAQQVHPSRLPPGEGRTAKARIQLPPGGKVLSSSSEFPAAGHPGAWGAEWDAKSLEPSYQSSAPKPGSAAPKGGAVGAGIAGLEALASRYGSHSQTLSNEQLRELLLIARGKYPAGDMQAQPAR